MRGTSCASSGPRSTWSAAGRSGAFRSRSRSRASTGTSTASNARGPRRRPARIEFCEADVLDAFDAWRRAVGIHRAESEAMPEAEDGGAGAGADEDGQAAPRPRSRESLATHLDRVIVRLTSLRTGEIARGVGRRPRRVRAHARRHAPGGAPRAGRGARRGSSPSSRRSTRACWSAPGLAPGRHCSPRPRARPPPSSSRLPRACRRRRTRRRARGARIACCASALRLPTLTLD